MALNRRSFLGWLGAVSGGLAVYSVSSTPSLATETIRPHVDPTQPSTAQYVIRNEGIEPMVVHYALKNDHTLDVGQYAITRGRGTIRISTPLLPGEELTITAAKMQY